MAILAFSEITDKGRRRQSNEDSLISLPDHGVFCVSDGMGGADYGERASRFVTESIRETFSANPPCSSMPSISGTECACVAAVATANERIRAMCREQLGVSMGTTVVAVLVDRCDHRRAITLHAGDSRVYTFRDGVLEQKTRDHSVAGMLGVAEDGLAGARFKGAITRSVGMADIVDLERNEMQLKDGDVVMLCSDGLHGQISLDVMGALFQRHAEGPLDALAAALVAEANRSGGKDNVSVILVRIAGGDEKAGEGKVDDLGSERAGNPRHGGWGMFERLVPWRWALLLAAVLLAAVLVVLIVQAGPETPGRCPKDSTLVPPRMNTAMPGSDMPKPHVKVDAVRVAGQETSAQR